MIEWTFIIKTTIAMIAIVDPPGCLPIYLSLTGQHKNINKKNVAKMTALTVFIILVVSLFLGDKILNIFGISMPSAESISRVIGAVGTKIVTRIMGLLLGSMAIEFITRGVLDIIA